MAPPAWSGSTSKLRAPISAQTALQKKLNSVGSVVRVSKWMVRVGTGFEAFYHVTGPTGIGVSFGVSFKVWLRLELGL